MYTIGLSINWICYNLFALTNFCNRERDVDKLVAMKDNLIWLTVCAISVRFISNSLLARATLRAMNQVSSSSSIPTIFESYIQKCIVYFPSFDSPATVKFIPSEPGLATGVFFPSSAARPEASSSRRSPNPSLGYTLRRRPPFASTLLRASHPPSNPKHVYRAQTRCPQRNSYFLKGESRRDCDWANLNSEPRIVSVVHSWSVCKDVLENGLGSDRAPDTTSTNTSESEDTLISSPLAGGARRERQDEPASVGRVARAKARDKFTFENSIAHPEYSESYVICAAGLHHAPAMLPSYMLYASPATPGSWIPHQEGDRIYTAVRCRKMQEQEAKLRNSGTPSSSCRAYAGQPSPSSISPECAGQGGPS
ncbi:hypothetical protein B0H14DRAFT_3583646 [Mycena olivaceomarginata]|nr:hypothetical protein B0H14DRAFT_3583646 [Mycena olivaceomarginata]